MMSEQPVHGDRLVTADDLGVLQAQLVSDQFQQGTPPEAIYHYTRQPGVIGILQSCQLWCTDIRFLNDSRELTWTQEIANNLLERNAASLSNERVKGLHAEWRRALGFFPGYPLYVASFSEERDQLSQWRAYGHGGGYAIGLAPEQLIQAIPHAPLPGMLLRCIYDVDEQHALVRAALDRLTSVFERQPSDTSPASFAHHFFGYLLVAGACFKHPKFAEEREWRLVFRSRMPDRAATDFRVGTSTVVPYIKFPRNPNV